MKANEILKKLREDRGFTMKEVSKATGMKTPLISDYETGKKAIGMKVAIRFAEYYNVSLDYLMGRTTVKQMATEQPDPFASINVSELEKRIIKKYTELDEDARALSLELFRQFSTIFNVEQEEQKLPELPTAQIIQQTATQKQKEDDEDITYTTTIGAEMDRRKALEAVQRAGELDDAETKKNVG